MRTTGAGSSPLAPDRIAATKPLSNGLPYRSFNPYRDHLQRSQNLARICGRKPWLRRPAIAPIRHDLPPISAAIGAIQKRHRGRKHEWRNTMTPRPTGACPANQTSASRLPNGAARPTNLDATATAASASRPWPRRRAIPTSARTRPCAGRPHRRSTARRRDRRPEPAQSRLCRVDGRGQPRP